MTAHQNNHAFFGLRLSESEKAGLRLLAQADERTPSAYLRRLIRRAMQEQAAPRERDQEQACSR